MRPIVKSCLGKKKNINHPETCFVFYDFETRQNTKLDENTFIHTPNLCVAQLCCDGCVKNTDLNALCNFCGVRQHIYEGDNCLENFLNFVIRFKKNNFSSFVCIAHNARASDAQFVLKFICENKKNMMPEVILNGRNIIKLQVGITKFIV